MPFRQRKTIRFFQFDSLMKPGIIHGVVSRRGGVSPQPWESLNVGGTVGDEPVRVAKNRRRILKAFSRTQDSVFDVWQVHSTKPLVAYAPRGSQDPQKADIILTDSPDVTLLMRFADCVPIFLYDPVRKAVGLVHAGWKGTVGKAAAVAVQAFQVAFGCQSKDILAGIGPSICRDCYPVGSDVVQEVEKAFGPKAERYIQHSNGIPHFDLWSANQDLLASAGVTQIELAQICTATNTQDWYSHRAEEGETGRFGVIIALKG